MPALQTEKLGTETADGWINHALVNNGDRSFLAPVKLDFSKRGDFGYTPLRRDGGLVFSLPGGGEIIIPESDSDNPEEVLYTIDI
jgi:hypothetical protein